MDNLKTYGFVELSSDDLLMIDGGEGFWEDLWNGICDFFRGIGDGIISVSLPM